MKEKSPVSGQLSFSMKEKSLVSGDFSTESGTESGTEVGGILPTSVESGTESGMEVGGILPTSVESGTESGTEVGRILPTSVESIMESEGAAVFATLSYDVRRAFDQLDHSKLIQVLTERNVPPELLHLVASYLGG